jgi:hypothetical protein
MKKRLFILWFALLCVGCQHENSDQPDQIPEILLPLGQTWATINGNPVRFTNGTGVFAEAAAGYTTSIKFLSIYRAVSAQDPRSLQIRATVDLDNINTPIDLIQNIKITYTTLMNGQKSYNGEGKDIKFKLIDKNNDVIKAVFSGILTNQMNSSDKIELKDGTLNVQVKRF